MPSQLQNMDILGKWWLGGGGNDKTKTKPFAMNLKHHLLGFSSVIGVEVS
jgi:hypothetical protein